MTSQSRWAIGVVIVVGLAVTTVAAQTQPRVPRFKEDVQVTSGEQRVRGSSGDHRLTFSGPFALPDVSLSAGTYIFRPGPANTLQVLSADGLTAYAWLLTIPVSRQSATRSYEVRFGDPGAAGAPRRLTTFFEPRQTWGYELIYASGHAYAADVGRQVAQASR